MTNPRGLPWEAGLTISEIADGVGAEALEGDPGVEGVVGPVADVVDPVVVLAAVVDVAVVGPEVAAEGVRDRTPRRWPRCGRRCSRR